MTTSARPSSTPLADRPNNDAFPTFIEFFDAVHGFSPYDWQSRLAAYISENGHVPGRVSVPTGLGKTSTVDAVLWALARQIHRGEARTIGLRIFNVVERRIIAEGTGAHITELVDAVNAAESGSIIAPVSAALRSLSINGGNGPAATATTFHGSHRQVDPLSPSGVQIISTTVSQYTLRIAGRAPGRGPAPRASEAGLAMLDAVVLLDEPHLSTAQVHSITTAMRSQRAFTVPGIPAPQVSVLGATIPAGLTVDPGVIGFTPDTETEAAKLRWSGVYRPLEIATCDATDKAVVDALVAATVGNAVTNEGRRRRSRVLVIANTVNIAEKVHAALSKKTPKGYTVALATGRFRALDRLNADDLGAPNTITVATQVVEAGVDFTCDLLVTELPSWPALTQRLGRLNRDGSARENALSVAITPIKSSKDGKRASYGTTGAQAVYGENALNAVGAGLTAVFDAAQEHAEVYTKKISVSPAHLDTVVAGMLAHLQDCAETEFEEHLRAWSESSAAQRKKNPAPQREVLDSTIFWPASPTPATITTALGSSFLETAAPVLSADTWRQGIDPPINPLLEPVTVAWRGVPAGAPKSSGLASSLLGRMPLPQETVQVPVTMARDLVDRSNNPDRTDGIGDEVADDSRNDLRKRNEKGVDTLRNAVVFRDGRWIAVARSTQVRPGDCLVFDAADGGYTAERGVRVGSEAPVNDVSLCSALDMGRWAPLTEASLLGAGLDDLDVVEIIDALYPVDNYGEIDESVSARARARAARPILTRALGSMGDTRQNADITVQFVAGVPAVFIPQEGGSTGPVGLHDHLRQVGDLAGLHATAAGMTLFAEVTVAGWHHDTGKAHPDYQRKFRATGELLAKPAGTPLSVGILPEHWRHEFASMNSLPQDASPLTRWLVASHHGRGRGPWHGQVETAAVGYLRRELETAYGPWGVAYLEAILRFADIQASAAPHTGLAPLPDQVLESIASVQGTDATDIGTPTVPVTGAQTRLNGLSAARFIELYAALGASAVLGLYDPETSLRWDGTTPVVTTSADMRVLEGSEELWATAVEELFTVKSRSILSNHHKLDWHPTAVDGVKGVAVPAETVASRAGAIYTNPLAALLASAVFSPHLPRQARNDAPAVALCGLALYHSNGTLFGPTSRSAKEVSVCDTDALFDAAAGKARNATKRVGRMDTDPDTDDGEHRAGLLVWALIGALLVPQVSDRGSGVTGTSKYRRTLTLPQVPMRPAEVADVFRAGEIRGNVVRTAEVTTVQNMLYTLPGELEDRRG